MADRELCGLRVRPAETELVTAVVAGVTGTKPALPVEMATHTGYLFAAYRHGYDVAHYGDGEWLWGSQFFGDRPGDPRAGAADGLERIRIFDERDELLVTRIAGHWRGWWQHRTDEPAVGPLRPRPRSYLVTRGRIHTTRGPFTRIDHESGQFAVLPYRFEKRRGYAHACEFFTTDPATGAVRVAAVTWTGYGHQPHHDGEAP